LTSRSLKIKSLSTWSSDLLLSLDMVLVGLDEANGR
jgi:hypothetical protein